MTPSQKGAKQPVRGLTDEEKAAMREAVRERRAGSRAGGSDPEHEALAKIAAMEPPDRSMAERLHAIVRANVPTLTARTWYGMPAYAKDDRVVCFFKPAAKFKMRYATLGFSDEAHLDESRMWATEFALLELSTAEEERILALLKKAVDSE